MTKFKSWALKPNLWKLPLGFINCKNQQLFLLSHHTYHPESIRAEFLPMARPFHWSSLSVWDDLVPPSRMFSVQKDSIWLWCWLCCVVPHGMSLYPKDSYGRKEGMWCLLHFICVFPKHARFPEDPVLSGDQARDGFVSGVEVGCHSQISAVPPRLSSLEQR